MVAYYVLPDMAIVLFKLYMLGIDLIDNATHLFGYHLILRQFSGSFMTIAIPTKSLSAYFSDTLSVKTHSGQLLTNLW